MGKGSFARFTRIKHPVARDEGLLVEDVADETVIYDARTKEAHCLSPLAAVVFANCDGRTSIKQLSARASTRLGEPIDEPRIFDALAQLQERDLLAVPPHGEGFSRREMIGKSAAVAGGFAGASLITSIVAPAAIAANTATCANVLCCGCCTGGTFSDKACCSAPSTVSCQCSGTKRLDRTYGDLNKKTNEFVVDGGKFCKPAGNNAFTDGVCQQMYDSTVEFPPGSGNEVPYVDLCVTSQTYTGQDPGDPPGAACQCRSCDPTDPTTATGCIGQPTQPHGP